MKTWRVGSLPAAALAAALAAAPAAAQDQSQSGQQGARGRPPEMQQAVGDVRNQILADRVFLRIAESPSLDQANVRVRTQEGVVTLEGTVPSEQAKQRALRIARRVRGVQEVRDQLRVSQQAPASGAAQAQTVDDGELVKRIAQKMASETFPNAEAQEDWLFGWEIESQVADWEFDVEADQGVVELHGTVGSFSDIRRAVEAARGVQGVRAVRNNLSVEGMPFYGRPYDGFYGPYGYGYGWYDPYAYGPYDAEPLGTSGASDQTDQGS